MMKQQVMLAPKKIEFRQVPMPKLEKGQVLIKIMRIGICGSDIHVYHGKHPFTKYPVTQGHEVSGVVYEVADDVEKFKVGQKVTIEPQFVCGTCHPCRHGKYNLCEELKVMGFQTTGAASEYFAVDEGKVTLLPDNMTFDEGAMIEPLAVTVHAAKRVGQISGANVLVLGSGPIGILLAQTCKALGAKKVIITDVSDTRLNYAKQCNVDFTVNTAETDIANVISEEFGSDKADVIYDCAGNNITMAQAIANARKGSKIVLVAVFADMANVDLATLNDKELTLDTSMMYRHEDYETAIELTSNGKINLNALMSKHFDFQDFSKAYEYIDENIQTTMKVLIDVNKE